MKLFECGLKFGKPEEWPEAVSSRVKPDLADNQMRPKYITST